MENPQSNVVDEPRHAIQVVARRTGLSADVIRVWERRYSAVSPSRNGNARRLYSDADVERLVLLRRVTRAGYRIGEVAALATDDLASLIAEDAAALAAAEVAGEAGAGIRQHLEACLTAVKRLDPSALRAALEHASASVSLPVLLEEVIGPLAVQVGALWARGALRVFHEHMLTAQLAVFLNHLRLTGNAHEHGPVLLVATPAGQYHELGALMVAVAAANEGWQVVYLNPNAPAAELAAAARQCGARAVALSIVYPADDRRLSQELATLKNTLEPGVELLVGGRSAAQYRSSFEPLGIRLIESLAELRAVLAGLRS